MADSRVSLYEGTTTETEKKGLTVIDYEDFLRAPGPNPDIPIRTQVRQYDDGSSWRKEVRIPDIVMERDVQFVLNSFGMHGEAEHSRYAGDSFTMAAYEDDPETDEHGMVWRVFRMSGGLDI